MTNGEITNTYEHKAVAETKSLVILLHGLGSNGQDLISLSPLWAQELPNTTFISPDAPFVCDMVPPGYPNAYQWFSLQDRDPHKILSGVEIASPILKAFIEGQAAKYDVPLSKIVLCGFSQGTMMSFYTAPRLEEQVAGVLGYSGALVGGEGFAEDPEEYQRPPVYMVHGEADEVVPLSSYRYAMKTLKAAGFDVNGHSTPGLAHSIDQKGIDEGAAFLKDVLK